MLSSLIKAKHVRGYLIEVKFNDGTKKTGFRLVIERESQDDPDHGARIPGWRSIHIMPTIIVFFGIIIRMFYRDHNPPHFHAEYQGQNATFDFGGKLLEGEIDSRTGKALIRKWHFSTSPNSVQTGRTCGKEKNLLGLNL
jgi:hypothetical protein